MRCDNQKMQGKLNQRDAERRMLRLTQDVVQPVHGNGGGGGGSGGYGGGGGNAGGDGGVNMQMHLLLEEHGPTLPPPKT